MSTIPEKIESELDAPYELPEEAISSYQENGFVHLSSVLSPETIEFFRDYISQRVAVKEQDAPPLEERDTFKMAFLQVMNLWTQDETIRRLVLSPRLARLATELMGVDGVRIYHDQALYKEPGGGKTPWHADQYYWPIDTDKTTTIWLPLQETPLEMGPLSFSPGSQHITYGREFAISEESERDIGEFLRSRDQGKVEEPFHIGDASFHSGWTFHRAGPNSTDTPRRVITVIYMDKDARVVEPRSEAHRKDLERWLPGCKPGEIAASEINPVLWER